MKQRIAFAAVMGLFTSSIITFAVIALNYGLHTGFFLLWLRSWAVSYALAFLAILVIGPRVKALVDHLLNEPATHKK
jgi:hypothetical protein